jgi:poly-gamma-glutamate synthesis protein (capsule biosynthesis protein)
MLAGDVMHGRGIDQILASPSPPRLHEPHAKSAQIYVALAEERNGPLPRKVPDAYVWGDALGALAARAPDVRIVNLETAVTRSDRPAADKDIHYRMNPANTGVLRAASIDCCVLANNHVLDWGEDGLVETLETLAAAGIATAGAGRDAAEAAAPAVLNLAGRRRILVYGFACRSAGVPASWAAGPGRPGVRLLAEAGGDDIQAIAAEVRAARQAGDIVVASIHWGPNWGYDIERARRETATRLIDEAGVDLVHGHSSHHPAAVAFHRGRAILYGCGDLLNDYEGIEGEEDYRPDLALIYLAGLDQAGRCTSIEMLPFRIGRFRLNRAEAEEAGRLARTMARECGRFGGQVTLAADDGGGLVLTLSPDGRRAAGGKAALP